MNFQKPLSGKTFRPATPAEVKHLHDLMMMDKLTPEDFARIRELEEEEWKRKYQTKKKGKG